MSEVLGSICRPAEAPSLLLVEDEVLVRNLLVGMLSGAGCAVQAVASGEAAVELLEQRRFELALLDVNLPGMDGMQVLARGRALQPDAQFVLLTGHGTVDLAVEAIRRGAFDFISKPVPVARLLTTLEAALRERAARLAAALLPPPGDAGALLVGESAVMSAVRERLQRAAPSAAPVLITGERGTGKKQAARALHLLSGRGEQPLQVLGCARLDDTAFAVELLGCAAGSLAGVTRARAGRLEQAAGGTLVLDGIEHLPPAAQQRLRQVLEVGGYTRLGSSRVRPLTARIVATTRLEPLELSLSPGFDAELLAALAVFSLALPPLREREDDVLVLAEHFRHGVASRLGGEPPAFAPAALRELREYGWPGNVRELHDYVERALHLGAGAASVVFEPPLPAAAPHGAALIELALRERWSLQRLEREYILATLREVHFHQARAAERLGLDRRTLYRKVKQYWQAGELAENELTGIG